VLFRSGFNYSFALLSILFCHEMGHYLYARYYKVKVTLPYFLPFYFPLMFSFGTFGAFIRLKEPIPNKKALFDIGIAGPLAGFVVSLIFLVLGFQQISSEAAMWDTVAKIHPLSPNSTGVLTFGGNLLFDFIAQQSGKSYLPMYEMYHFPLIVAGWFGLLITSLNLMPIGQLDGGHITHAMFGGKSARIAVVGFAALIGLNVYLISQFNSFVYILWPFLIVLFIKFKHPPTLDDSVFKKIASYQDNAKLKGLGQSSYGAEYSFIDKLVVLGQEYTYKLVDVSYNGAIKEHEAIHITLPLSYNNLSSISSLIPKVYNLQQNYPNPFNPETNIRFDIPIVESGNYNVDLMIFNIAGQRVKTFFNGSLSPGKFITKWDGKNDFGQNVSTGMYFLIMRSNNFIGKKKLLLIK